ncbi:MAG: hypothetical protein IPL46_20330 [Saprospiraceae bacterium]|nr:hypothetical protein [Saprospiraceae bacterium]
MKNLNATILFFSVLTLVLITSCAHPENLDACVNPSDTRGFLFGLIHGFIAPLTFIFSLFMDDVAIYAVNNSGGWYDFGFLLGIGGFSGGIFRGSRKKR